MSGGRAILRWVALLASATCLFLTTWAHAGRVDMPSEPGAWRAGRAPSILIQLSDNALNFPALPTPGIAAAPAAVSLAVISTYGSWRVVAQASDLAGDVGALPASRLLVNHNLSTQAWYPLAGAGFQSLDEHRVVAYGGRGGAVVSNTLLDLDNSESPVHGQQEGSSHNGHFEFWWIPRDARETTAGRESR